jgi:hypothetical protein
MASTPQRTSQRGRTEPTQLNIAARFIYGVLGAVSPEVVRWSKVALHYKPSDLPDSWSLYIVVMIVFELCSGFFSTLWEDNNRIKCFYLGVTFPLFVSAMLAGTPKLPAGM